jgi:hypothetical protein
LSQVYERSRDVVVQQVGEDAILVPSWSSGDGPACIYRLNPVGAFLWNRIDGERTVTDLATAVCQEFAASVTDVERDVRQFLLQLEGIGAARPLGSASGCRRQRGSSQKVL